MVGYRSSQWYGGTDRNAYIHRAWMRRGLPAQRVRRPPAHRHRQHRLRSDARATCTSTRWRESVKQGVYEAGGIPLNLPVVSLGETQVRPTAMLWRNMAAMATEEMLRANPIDGVVLLGGCDKTIPSLLMAAASVDLPAVVDPRRPDADRHVPRRAARLRHRRLEAVRGGPRRHAVERAVPEVRVVDDPQQGSLQHHGHRLDHGAWWPRRWARSMPGSGRHAGRRTAGCWRGRTRPAGWPSNSSSESGGRATILTRGSFLNAIVALAAIGGSTNAVVHLLAIAGRLGVELTLDDFDRTGAGVPLLVDLQPAGRFLMEDFHRAGGLLAVLREVRDLLDPAALTVTGRPLVHYLDDAPIWDPEVIRAASRPAAAARRDRRAVRQSRARRRGDQAGRGVAGAAAAPRPGGGVRHRSRTCTPGSTIPDLDVDADSVLVLRGCGPQGLPGDAGGGEHAVADQAAASRVFGTWSGSATAG